MKKILLAITVTVFSVNCFAESKTESIEKSFSWVSADRNELQRLAYDRLKNETSYPSEINIDEQKLNEKRSESQTNLSKYENQGRKGCNDKLLPKDATDSRPAEVRNFESRGLGMATDPDWDKYYKIRSSKEYMDCITNIADQSEYKSLKEKQKDTEALSRKRRDFDEGVRKQAEKVLETIVADFSQQNNIQLIIHNRSDAIIYNRDLVVLDVTPKIKAIINSKKSMKE
jgi:hypothetical protein